MIYKQYMKYGLVLAIVGMIIYGIYTVIQQNGEYKERLDTITQQNQQLTESLNEQAELFETNMLAINKSMLFYQTQLEESTKRSNQLIEEFRAIDNELLQQCFNLRMPDSIINQLNLGTSNE